MPAPGDQHKAWANPYEEARPRISEWTAKEIATISLRLDKQLGPEYISSRAGPGGSRVHYLTAEKCIGLANEIFGFNGWSSSIQNIQVDFADENPQTQRVSIGLSVIVRITLRDGTYHEDVGYGSIENARGKAMAFEKAKKEGTTDALKRTLRSFGNVLGNCIYDQDYVKQVTKIKAQPVRKFDQDNLHRHSDFAKKDMPVAAKAAASGSGSGSSSASAAPAVKVEAMESFEDFLGDFDEADFCVSEEGHPDEVVVPVPAAARGPQTRLQQPQQASRAAAEQPNQRPPQPQTPNPQYHRQAAANGPCAEPAAPLPAAAGEPVAAFFSARAVVTDANQSASVAANKQQLFNPKAESPSIRKTPGIDHSSSKPVSRAGQHVPPPSQGAGGASAATLSRPSAAPAAAGEPHGGGGGSHAASKGHAVNPSLDHARRIGAPGGPASPLANRNSYKPPTMMKRPLAQGEGGTPRVPLSEMPPNGPVTDAVGGTAAGGCRLDAKRQKMV